MSWVIEKRKQGMEIYATNRETESIFIGEGYTQKEYKRSMELAKVIVTALNDYEEKNEDDFVQSLRENDSGINRVKMKLLTWVFCEDCFRHDYKCHEVPNFMSSEVKITKARNHFDSVEVTFDCLNCKEQKRKYKNKKSLVDITTDQPHDNSGVTHPYL